MNIELLARLAELRRAATYQHGQALVEYALVVSLIALVAVAALTATGNDVSTIFTKVAGDI